MDVFAPTTLQTKRYLILFLSVYITWVMGISSGAAGGFQSLFAIFFHITIVTLYFIIVIRRKGRTSLKISLTFIILFLLNQQGYLSNEF
ncbi:hypothetical protein B9Z19DRAFT_1081878 [Tuber borchii]|uniref:Uncharacterized protein n=1 Tax=Tuber borchii TaxID=42251 RepID=A0A2T6ZV78_TUBBO|nr:hypothetical protein B9Z19DRAFT_1081878 [Tuber borchii]